MEVFPLRKTILDLILWVGYKASMGDLTTKQAAERLGKDGRLVRLWCQQGRFPHAYLQETPRGPIWLIPENDLKGFEPPPMGRPPRQIKPKKGSKK